MFNGNSGSLSAETAGSFTKTNIPIFPRVAIYRYAQGRPSRGKEPPHRLPPHLSLHCFSYAILCYNDPQFHSAYLCTNAKNHFRHNAMIGVGVYPSFWTYFTTTFLSRPVPLDSVLMLGSSMSAACTTMRSYELMESISTSD